MWCWVLSWCTTQLPDVYYTDLKKLHERTSLTLFIYLFNTFYILKVYLYFIWLFVLLTLTAFSVNAYQIRLNLAVALGIPKPGVLDVQRPFMSNEKCMWSIGVPGRSTDQEVPRSFFHSCVILVCHRLITSAPTTTSSVILQHLNLHCFTSCCQEFSTLRLTSTPFFYVLCFFQFYSHYTTAVNGNKSSEWLKALQKKNPLSACAALSKRVKCLLE